MVLIGGMHSGKLHRGNSVLRMLPEDVVMLGTPQW